MNIISIVRIHSVLNSGIFGVLSIIDRLFCFTKELPWKSNKQNISCIPEGEYDCSLIKVPKFGWTYNVLNVKGRKNILFHWGSYLSNSRGCILIGSNTSIERKSNEILLLNTRSTFESFMSTMNGVNNFRLKIRSIVEVI